MRGSRGEKMGGKEREHGKRVSVCLCLSLSLLPSAPQRALLSTSLPTISPSLLLLVLRVGGPAGEARVLPEPAVLGGAATNNLPVNSARDADCSITSTCVCVCVCPSCVVGY